MHACYGSTLLRSALGVSRKHWRQHPPILLSWTTIRNATHAAQGRANGPKNGPGQRLGAKKSGDEYVVPGNIIFRQRGTQWFPGENVGMGRDHTIFALQPGYVKYYKDPRLHPRRRYIGIVFEKTHALPSSFNAPRHRRLGLIAVSREKSTGSIGALDGNTKKQFELLEERNNEASSILEAAKRSGLTKNEIREERQRKATGRIANESLQMRPNYSYRESNWEIGRVAERAGVRSFPYDKGNRFLAWRKRAARRSMAAEKRAIGRSKGSAKGKSRGK